MRKFYNLLLLLLVMCITTNAQDQIEMEKNALPVLKAQTKVAQGFGYGNRFTESIYGLGYNQAGVVSGLIEVSGIKNARLTFVDAMMPAMEADKNGAIVVLDKNMKVVHIEQHSFDIRLNHLVLNTPYTFMTNETYYVGYLVHATAAAAYPVGFDKDVNIPQASYMSYHTSMPTKGTSMKEKVINTAAKYNYGAILIFLGLENSPKTDNAAYLLDVSGTFNSPSKKTAEAKASVRNIGAKAMTTAEMKYTIGGNATTATVTTNIKSGADSEVAFKVNMPTKGKGEIAFNVSKVNGTDNFMSNVTVTKAYQIGGGGMSTTKRSVLIERFSTEQCPNCPAADPTLETFINTFRNAGLEVNVVVHHAGYYTDGYTLEESRTLVGYLGVKGAPYFVVDRLPLGQNGVCAFFPQSYMAANIKSALLKNKELGKVDNIQAGFKNNGLTVKLVGTVADEFKEDLYITAILTEDNLSSNTQRGASYGYIHEAVPRVFLSSGRGDKATINDGQFEISFPTKTINSKWKKNNMKIVLFGHRLLNSYTQYDYDQHEILFSTTYNWSITNGVEDIRAEEINPEVTSKEGRIQVNGTYKRVEIYNTSGALIATSVDEPLTQGLYIVKVKTNEGSYASKVMIQ